MLLSEAAEVAASRASGLVDTLLTEPTIRRRALDLIADAFWSSIWPQIRHERIKVNLWLFRPSARVEALRFVFVRIFGEPKT